MDETPMKNAPLLIEMLVEELPPKALAKLGQSFSQTMREQLLALELIEPSSVEESFATPRRLAVLFPDVRAQAPAREVRQKLMPVKVGLDASGQATAALAKKLASMGLADLKVSDLEVVLEGATEHLWITRVQEGVSLQVGAQKALNEAIAQLPIPKVMSYQLHSNCDLPGWSSVNFVRPVHALVALHAEEVLDLTALGLKAGRHTKGHRFEAQVDALEISSAASYEQTLLQQGAVMASYAKRRARIVQLLDDAAKSLGPHFHVSHDEALLDEVCALVEMPNVLICQFEEEFLQVPQECLILTMKANQKYFPLINDQGALVNRFLVVSNISPKDTRAVVGGNERVVRPRLSDAKFFFDQDRKITLKSRSSGLAKVVYHQQLGTQAQRTQRVQSIAQGIAEELIRLGKLGAQESQWIDEAAQIAKVDLLTDMVGEFPELQGIMGQYYALHEGYAKEVAYAVEDHYKPKFAGDTLPRGMTGVVLALADKLETLVGLFSIGQVPTGDKDPYALRRHAIGVIRLLREKSLGLSVQRLLAIGAAAFHGQKDDIKKSAQDISTALLEFIYDRLSINLKDQGYSSAQVESVLSIRPDVLDDVDLRLMAVRDFVLLPEALSLASANKRISNILKKSEGVSIAQEVDERLLTEDAELGLYQTMKDVLPVSAKSFDAQDYAQSLKTLAQLKASVDLFFEKVMVNAPDEALRLNRLALLSRLHQAMNKVADLSRLV
jgi:glycyl-tRNA synthetase beta chain